MKDTIQDMMERRSVRSYGPEPVTEEELETILKAGSYAPSGMGRQPVVMVAVQDQKTRDLLSRMNAGFMGKEGADPFYGAATVIVVLADRTAPTYLYDGSLVMGNLMNAAQALGVDSCWIHRAKEEFDSEEGKKLLKAWGLDGDYEGIGHCILGNGAGPRPEAQPRRDGRVIYVR